MRGIDPCWHIYDAKWIIKKTFLKDSPEVFIWHLAFQVGAPAFLSLTEKYCFTLKNILKIPFEDFF